MTEQQEITRNLEAVTAELPAGVSLVAVSKFHPASYVEAAYAAGQRKFGESRVQEFLAKKTSLPADIEWHFIGHLQSNKVKQLVGEAFMIESIDSEKLLALVDRRAEEIGVCQNVLLQLHVAEEETKFGFSPEEVLDYFTARRFEYLKAVHICGLMAMATNTDDTARVDRDFLIVCDTFARIKALCPDLRGFDILSMGMTQDWQQAVACGSNEVRIGSAIFGLRDYNNPSPAS